MTRVNVIYSYKADYWNADCQEVPQLAAGSPSLPNLRILVRDALCDFLNDDRLEILESTDSIETKRLP